METIAQVLDDLMPPVCIKNKCVITVDMKNLIAYHNGDPIFPPGEFGEDVEMKELAKRFHVLVEEWECVMCHGEGACDFCDDGKVKVTLAEGETDNA